MSHERTRDGREERIERRERETRSGLAERREEPRRARRGNPGEAGSEVETRERRARARARYSLTARALTDLSGSPPLSRARPTALSRSLARRRARADRVSESTRGKYAPCTHPRSARAEAVGRCRRTLTFRVKDRHASSCTRRAPHHGAHYRQLPLAILLTTSEQARSPAEFKHIIKRRKRN